MPTGPPSTTETDAVAARPAAGDGTAPATGRSAQTARRRLFHGWKLVMAGAAIQALHSGLLTNSFGNYAVLLQRQFGWSRTNFSLAFSLMRVESGLLGPAQGWALDRFGTTRVMRVGAVLMGLGLVAFSQIRSLPHFFVALAVAAVGASLSGFLSITSATVRWFERNRAKALSLSGTGFAIGGIVTPAVVWILRTIGWRWTAALSGLVVVAISYPLAGLFGPSPADRGEYVDGVEPGPEADKGPRAEGVSDVHFSAREAVRTRAFWMISLGHASALLVVGAVIAHLALYLTSEQGFELQEASFVAGAMPLLQFFGQIGGGVLGDRVNKRLLASVAMIGHMLGLLLLTYATARWMIWLFVPLHGLAWGIRGPLMQALRADYFGSTSFAKIMGLSSLVVMMGMLAGPLVAGVLADRTGSYRFGFTLLAILAGFGMLFFVLATPPPQSPARSEAVRWPERRRAGPILGRNGQQSRRRHQPQGGRADEGSGRGAGEDRDPDQGPGGVADEAEREDGRQGAAPVAGNDRGADLLQHDDHGVEQRPGQQVDDGGRGPAIHQPQHRHQSADHQGAAHSEAAGAEAVERLTEAWAQDDSPGAPAGQQQAGRGRPHAQHVARLEPHEDASPQRPGRRGERGQPQGQRAEGQQRPDRWSVRAAPRLAGGREQGQGHRQQGGSPEGQAPVDVGRQPADEGGQPGAGGLEAGIDPDPVAELGLGRDLGQPRDEQRGEEGVCRPLGRSSGQEEPQRGGDGAGDRGRDV